MRTLRILSSLALAAALLLGVTHVAAVPAHRVCATYGAIYYDIRVGMSGTIMERWSNGQMLDSNWYAMLNMPVAPGAMWGDGVAWAATMQTRHVWVNMEPNTPGYWDVVNGEDIWRFSTTISGSPVELVFRSSQCVLMTAAPPTPAPPTTAAPPTKDPNAPSCVCGTAGQYYYEIRTGPSGTVMKRWTSIGQLVDSNTFARLNKPATPGALWSEGIVFAATMQTRHAWFNTAPNTPARWDVVSGEDIWSFDTTMNNLPFTQVFRSSLCVPVVTPPPTPYRGYAYRVCLVFGSTYYDIKTGPSGTTYVRRDYPSGLFKDSNTFATLNKPVPEDAMWGEGVQFAATMQTRNVWVNSVLNSAAWWRVVNNEIHWVFDTTIGGLPGQLDFRESQCIDWVL